MVECVTTHQEDLCEFFVVVGHHRRLGSLLGHGQEVMDVLDGTKSLLPQFQLDRSIELGKAGIEMVLEGIGVGKVNRVGLGRIFGHIGEVEAKSLAQTAEFYFPLMLQTKLESLLGDLLNKERMRGGGGRVEERERAW